MKEARGRSRTGPPPDEDAGDPVRQARTLGHISAIHKKSGGTRQASEALRGALALYPHADGKQRADVLAKIAEPESESAEKRARRTTLTASLPALYTAFRRAHVAGSA